MCTPLFAQSGVYVIDNNDKHTDGTILKWTLTLNNDGTFLYHFLRDLSAISKLNKEENFYGKGTWKVEKNLIFFSSDKETDLNEKYIYDFTNTKARWIKKSPRDLSDIVVKESLLFYESDLWVIERLKFIKISN
ncbi:hypothetical protein [Yeosuana sp.]|uniref:hypothetical protein n=1 Tax=Yeosuana sp. TaxID=2529388 RepID=UPI00405514D2